MGRCSKLLQWVGNSRHALAAVFCRRSVAIAVSVDPVVTGEGILLLT